MFPKLIIQGAYLNTDYVAQTYNTGFLPKHVLCIPKLIIQDACPNTDSTSLTYKTSNYNKGYLNMHRMCLSSICAIIQNANLYIHYAYLNLSCISDLDSDIRRYFTQAWNIKKKHFKGLVFIRIHTHNSCVENASEESGSGILKDHKPARYTQL